MGATWRWGDAMGGHRGEDGRRDFGWARCRTRGGLGTRETRILDQQSYGKCYRAVYRKDGRKETATEAQDTSRTAGAYYDTTANCKVAHRRSLSASTTFRHPATPSRSVSLASDAESTVCLRELSAGICPGIVRTIWDCSRACPRRGAFVPCARIESARRARDSVAVAGERPIRCKVPEQALLEYQRRVRRIPEVAVTCRHGRTANLATRVPNR